MWSFWIGATTLTFVLAIVGLLAALYAWLRLIGSVLPLLTETRQHVQDLGDIAAHTVGQASETMELVELRVSQAMGQATHAGATASKQSVKIGSALAGLYLASRVAGLFRQAEARAKAKDKGRGRNRRQERAEQKQAERRRAQTERKQAEAERRRAERARKRR